MASMSSLTLSLLLSPEHEEHDDKDLHVDEKKPTCCEKGNSEGWKCDVCGDYEYEVYEPDPAAYHKYLSDNQEALLADGTLEWKVTNPGDGSVGSGMQAILCPSCGYIVNVKLYPEVQAGDVNMDGRVNSIDALMILQYKAGVIATLPNLVAADCDGVEGINSLDALWILNSKIN